MILWRIHMGGNTLKIKRLLIDKLYGNYNYDVSFNEDITFLYGENGCGKTTILNIITKIITGRVYELTEYQFNKIRLDYQQTDETKIESIEIVNLETHFILNVFDTGNDIRLNEMELREYRDPEIKYDIEKYYFNKYEILDQIRNLFNYLFLPLNRTGNINGDSMGFNDYVRYTRARIGYSEERIPTVFDFDFSIRNVKYLVKKANNKVNFKLNKISESFNDQILKSFLDVESIPEIRSILDDKMSLDREAILKTKEDYTTVLKNMKLWDDDVRNKIDSFFNSLLEDIYSNEKDSVDTDIFKTIFEISEFKKIRDIIKKAENNENAKKKVQQPITDFLKTVNSFIQSENKNKKVYINYEDGELYLQTQFEKKISIEHLSSGEKQIVTFFAYLIFGLEETKQSIFIVDEPELSLHLSWQREFVSSVLNINQDIQLIFATHAPEIIGKNIDKAVKLIPELNKGEDNE